MRQVFFTEAEAKQLLSSSTIEIVRTFKAKASAVKHRHHPQIIIQHDDRSWSVAEVTT